MPIHTDNNSTSDAPHPRYRFTRHKVWRNGHGARATGHEASLANHQPRSAEHASLLRYYALADNENEVVEFHHPSIPANEPSSAQVEAAVLWMAGALAQQGREPEARALILRFMLRVAPAIAARQAAEARAEANLEHRKGEWQKVVDDTESKRTAAEDAQNKANKAFGEAQAAAGVTLPPDTQPSPFAVEQAIRETGPDEGEVAVEAQAGPAPASRPPAILRCLRDIFRLLPGTIFPFCFGAMTHLVSVQELQRGDNLPLLVGCAAIGFSLLYSMGLTVHAAVRAWGHVCEPCQLDTPSTEPEPSELELNVHQASAGEDGPTQNTAQPTTSQNADSDQQALDTVPGYKHLPAAIMLVLLLVIQWLAEVLVEAVGIRELSRAIQDNHSQLSAAGGGLLPLPLYILIGTLISTPFLASEFGLAWIEQQDELRAAWQRRRQRKWLKGRMADAAVTTLMEQAAAVQRAGNELKQIEAKLTALRETEPAMDENDLRAVKIATATEIGEVTLLHTYLDSITATPQQPQPTQSAKQPWPLRLWSRGNARSQREETDG